MQEKHQTLPRKLIRDAGNSWLRQEVVGSLGLLPSTWVAGWFDAHVRVVMRLYHPCINGGEVRYCTECNTKIPDGGVQALFDQYLQARP